jgi:hypothetical protein
MEDLVPEESDDVARPRWTRRGARPAAAGADSPFALFASRAPAPALPRSVARFLFDAETLTAIASAPLIDGPSLVGNQNVNPASFVGAMGALRRNHLTTPVASL